MRSAFIYGTVSAELPTELLWALAGASVLVAAIVAWTLWSNGR